MPFPSLLLGEKLMIVQHKSTSTSEWSENTSRRKRVSFLKAVVVHGRCQQSKAAEDSPKGSIQVSRVSPNITTFLYQALKSLAAPQTITQDLFSAVATIRGRCGMSLWHYFQTGVSRQWTGGNTSQHVPVALTTGSPHASRETLPSSLCVLYFLNAKEHGAMLEYK